MHNSAARSEAAATALKSELVLPSPPLSPAPSPSPVPTLPRRRVNPLSLSLSSSFPVLRRSPLSPASFYRVAVPWSPARLNDSSGTIRGFLVCGPTRRGEDRAGERKGNGRIFIWRYYLLRSDGAAK